MGGAMDLVAGTLRVIVVTDHVSKGGTPTIVARCDLPLTGAGVVDRIISDLAVFDVQDGTLVLRAVAPGVTIDEVRARTGADFSVDRARSTESRPPRPSAKRRCHNHHLERVDDGTVYI